MNAEIIIIIKIIIIITIIIKGSKGTVHKNQVYKAS
jgi:hypothetical protein